jgi:N-carbamoyl-L-amino-acid hydrolase
VSLGARLARLDGIGTGPGGVTRLAWTDEDAATRGWFSDQAVKAGLETERDPAGNLWARPDTEPPWWGIGSHLDSVRRGGRFDGPLGVVCAFEIASGSSVPVTVISFADEEGARYGTPTFGSKALTGRLDLASVLDRVDGGDVALRDAMRAAGVDPGATGRAPSWLSRLAGFIEIHIDQTTDVAAAGAAVGVVHSLVSRMRVVAELRGRADHAGTTPPSVRRDALGTAARLIVAAQELGAGVDRMTVTSSRIEVEPNASTTIASRVRLWIDARAPALDAVDSWLEALRRVAAELSAATRVEIDVTVASRTEGVTFAAEVRAALLDAARRLGVAAPEVVCYAGHDAGVLAERVPAGMLFVRNETGVSHAPEEHVSLGDAEVACAVVARALEELAAR